MSQTVVLIDVNLKLMKEHYYVNALSVEALAVLTQINFSNMQSYY